MILRASIIALGVMMAVGGAMADQEIWPVLKSGEVKVVSGDAVKEWGTLLEAAGIAPGGDASQLHFTFFKAPHGRDLVVIDPCCRPGAKGASLFALEGVRAQPVPLAVGDPREGFLAQNHASAISIEPGAKALRARIAFADCEQGMWTYYYQFDEADRPVLLSVIDTGCGHLGVRELYHSKRVDVGHWWQH